jgi:hypothetical protein
VVGSLVQVPRQPPGSPVQHPRQPLEGGPSARQLLEVEARLEHVALLVEVEARLGHVAPLVEVEGLAVPKKPHL